MQDAVQFCRLLTLIYTPRENFSYFYDKHYFKGTVVTVAIHWWFLFSGPHASVTCSSLYSISYMTSFPLSCFFCWEVYVISTIYIVFICPSSVLFFNFSQCYIKEQTGQRGSELGFQSLCLFLKPILLFQENSIKTCVLSRVKQITSPGWMHETSARTWCTGKT